MLRKCIFAVAFVLAIMMTTTYARSLPEPQIVSSARARSRTPIDVVETSESRMYRHGDQLKEVEFYERATVRQPIDAVTYFTNNSKSRAMVSIIAAASVALLVHFVSMMLFSASSPTIFWAVAIVSGVATYTKGDFGDFCRAIGVGGLLLSQRTGFSKFLVKFVSQSKAALRMAERRPFPPSSNPWQYYPVEGEPDLRFNMFNTLLSLVLSAAYVGWLLVRPVPLLPNWLGAVAAAATLGYTSTARDHLGDLLRFLGHSLVQALWVVTDTTEEVQLRAKAATLLGHALVFTRSVDAKYKVGEKVQYYLADVVTKLTLLISRLRRDMSGEEPPPRRQSPHHHAHQHRSSHYPPHERGSRGAAPSTPYGSDGDEYRSYPRGEYDKRSAAGDGSEGQDSSGAWGGNTDSGEFGGGQEEGRPRQPRRYGGSAEWMR